jgi:pyruvate/2-oxoglutarate dehydrogenase complex dihydrolipoamide acyltransferase (E2) component
MIEVRVPAELWDGDLDGVVSAWLYQDGELVEAGAVIAELMSEKVAFSLEAPASGRLRILVPAEVAIRPAAVVATIDPS